MTDIEPVDRTTPSGCFPESVYSVYVDQELSPAQVRPVEAHLVTCRRCRERVMALEEETSLLRNVLQERALPARAPESAVPARGLVIGILPSLTAAFAVATALGWILETRMPSPLQWLNPLRLMGAFEMMFDAVFMLRDEAPAFFQLVVSGASLVSVAFLLTVAFSALARRWLGPGALSLGFLVIVLLASLAAPDPADAVELRLHREREVIAAGEVVEQTLVVSADSMTIDGTLRGNLIVLAERFVLNGQIDGDVFAAARSVELAGTVNGSVHVFAERIHVSGEITGNIYTVAENYVLEASGRVGRDGAHGGGGVTLTGEVSRDAFAISEWLDVRGRIGRDLDARAERITVGDGARLGGDLSARLFTDEESLEVSPGAVIAGETTRERVEIEQRGRLDHFSDTHFYLFTALGLGAAFLVGMLAYRIAPRLFSRRLDTGSDFFRALGTGGISMVAIPLGLLIVALTVVGIPIALIGYLGFGVAVYGAGIVVAGILGTAIFGEPEAGSWGAFGLPLFIGLAIIAAVGTVPFVGGLIELLVTMTGLGVMVDLARRRWLPGV